MPYNGWPVLLLVDGQSRSEVLEKFGFEQNSARRCASVLDSGVERADAGAVAHILSLWRSICRALGYLISFLSWAAGI